MAAHTAGLFRSVRGAKGGFPPWGLPKLRIFTSPPSWGLPKLGNFHFSPPWGLPKLGNFHFSPLVGAPQAREFHFSPPWGLPKLGNFHFSPPWGLPLQLAAMPQCQRHRQIVIYLIHLPSDLSSVNSHVNFSLSPYRALQSIIWDARNKMLDTNPWVKSRFSHFIEFGDCGLEDCLHLFHKRAAWM